MLTETSFQPFGAIISPLTKSIVYPLVLSSGVFLDGVNNVGVTIVPSSSTFWNNLGSNILSCGWLANLMVGNDVGWFTNSSIVVSIVKLNFSPVE